MKHDETIQWIHNQLGGITNMKLFEDLKGKVSMLVNVIHHKGNRDTNWVDYLDIIYKDENGEKKVINIEAPEMEVYFANEDARVDSFNRNYIRKGDTYSKIFPFKDLEFKIANELGGNAKLLVKQAMDNRNRAAIRNVHRDPNVFGSDYRIEDWYRIMWALHLSNDLPKPIVKNYLDIEVDGIDHPGFVVGGIAPINAITIIDDTTMTSRTFLLRNEKNPQIAEFEETLGEFIEDLHESFDEIYGKLEYEFYMYDEVDEIEMIQDIFKLLNTVNPDFVLIWNASFDIPYIIDRIVELGSDPATVMSHPDFPMKEAWFYKDKRNFNIPDKGDYTKLSSQYIVMDQMIVYGGLRKSQSEIRSYNLNYVGQREIGDSKLDYGEVKNFKTFPYENYKLFVKYNIKDVLLQMGIERRTEDVDNLYSRSDSNATAYEKIFKQTVFLKNRGYLEWDKQGLVMGNNTNVNYGENRDSSNLNVKKGKDGDGDSYEGGLVADPKNNDFVGVDIMGKKSKYIFYLTVDMDFSSMYPNIIIAFNIAPNTLIGKLVIGRDGAEVYSEIVSSESIDDIINNVDLGAEFVDDIQVADILTIAKKWFGLPSIDKLFEMADDEFIKDKSVKRFTFMVDPKKSENVKILKREVY